MQIEISVPCDPVWHSSAKPNSDPRTDFSIHASHPWKFLIISLSDVWSTYNLFLCVLVGAEQIDGLHVTKVDIVSEEEDKQ